MNILRNTSFKSLAWGLIATMSGLITANASVINVTVDTSGVLYNGVGVANKDQYGYANNNPESNLGFLNTLLGNYNAINSPDLPAGVGPVGADYGSLNGVNSYTTVGGYDYVVFHYGAGQAEYGEAPAWVPEVVVPPVYYTSGSKAGQIKTPGYTIPGHFAETDMQKSSGGWWAAFYIGGAAGISFNVPTPGPTYDDLVYNGQPVGGFSSARYFNEHVNIIEGGDPTPVPDNGASAILIGLGLASLALLRRKLA
jgi:hypothetical protein